MLLTGWCAKENTWQPFISIRGSWTFRTETNFESLPCAKHHTVLLTAALESSYSHQFIQNELQIQRDVSNLPKASSGE